MRDPERPSNLLLWDMSTGGGRTHTEHPMSHLSISPGVSLKSELTLPRAKDMTVLQRHIIKAEISFQLGQNSPG